MDEANTGMIAVKARNRVTEHDVVRVGVEYRTGRVQLAPILMRLKYHAGRGERLERVEAEALVRHGQRQNAAALEHPLTILKKADQVWRVFDHVRGDHEIEVI